MALNSKQTAALLAVSTSRKLDKASAKAAGVHHTVLLKLVKDGSLIVTDDKKLGKVHSLTEAGKAQVAAIKKEAAKAAKQAAKAQPAS